MKRSLPVQMEAIKGIPIATHIDLFRVLTLEQVVYNDKLITEFMKRGQL